MIIMDDYTIINMIKNGLVDEIQTLLDDLRNEKTYSIRESYVVSTDAEIEGMDLAISEICSNNPDICGRVDVINGLELSGNINLSEPVKGVTILLFLHKYQDRFDHPDIDRFYAQYPEFCTGCFDEEYNKYFSSLLDNILAVKEKMIPFSYIKLKLSKNNNDELVSDTVDKIEMEGLKCKVIKQKVSNAEYAYLFMYEIEYEEMNKQIEPLERRSSLRLVK